MRDFADAFAAQTHTLHYLDSSAAGSRSVRIVSGGTLADCRAKLDDEHECYIHSVAKAAVKSPAPLINELRVQNYAGLQLMKAGERVLCDCRQCRR